MILHQFVTGQDSSVGKVVASQDEDLRSIPEHVLRSQMLCLALVILTPRDDLSSVSSINMVEREPASPTSYPLTSTFEAWKASMLTNTHTQH